MLTTSFTMMDPTLGPTQRRTPVCGGIGLPGQKNSPPQRHHRFSKHYKAEDRNRRNETVALLRHRKDKGWRRSPLKLSRLMMITLSEAA